MIDDLIALARRAGEAILAVYDNPGKDLQIKKDASPLTRADTASHEIIAEGLRKISSFPIVSEEEESSHDNRKDWRNFWLVDPLDGTKDFLARNDEFSVNIALIEGHDPILGLMYAPACDECYVAERGKGACEIVRGVRRALPLKPCEGSVVTRSRFHDVPLLERFMKENGITESLTIGSALKFAALARGNASLYPRFTGSSEWDIAAGHILLKESGGGIVDLTTGKEPLYNKANLRNNWFLAFAKGIDYRNFKIPEE